MKHLIETTDLSSLPIVEYDRIILDSATNEITYRGVKYEIIPDQYIYNETDKKYYQKLVGYSNSNRIDLNNEWVSDTEDNDYRYFKSDSNVDVYGSYSQCKVTWSNLTSVTFKYMSSSSTSIDYLCVGYLDGEKFTARPSDGGSNVYLSTKGKTSGTYYEFTIECDKGEHHIWFCYQKGYGGNYGEDRGFIGVPKSVLSMLVKQGSELPTEYNKYGGISAEGGKTYDIYINNVTVPNGSIVTDYKNVEKTEKTITYEYVDLGLESGTSWATCNIGAETETDYGIYFQWGETSGVSGSLVGKYSDEIYDWTHYKHCNGSSDTLTKYNNDSRYGTVDNKTTLESVDDAATQIMGSDCRIPTQTEWQELLSGTTNAWTQVNGVSGYKFTSKTDTSKYIFIPAAGYCSKRTMHDVGSYGIVWSSSLYASAPGNAWYLHFFSSNCAVSCGVNYYGLTVRGVRK